MGNVSGDRGATSSSRLAQSPEQRLRAASRAATLVRRSRMCSIAASRKPAVLSFSPAGTRSRRRSSLFSMFFVFLVGFEVEKRAGHGGRRRERETIFFLSRQGSPRRAFLAHFHRRRIGKPKGRPPAMAIGCSGGRSGLGASRGKRLFFFLRHGPRKQKKKKTPHRSLILFLRLCSASWCLDA